MRGMGRIFKRGNIWHIAYSYRGREHRESDMPNVSSRFQKQHKSLAFQRTGFTVTPKSFLSPFGSVSALFAFRPEGSTATSARDRDAKKC